MRRLQVVKVEVHLHVSPGISINKEGDEGENDEHQRWRRWWWGLKEWKVRCPQIGRTSWPLFGANGTKRHTLCQEKIVYGAQNLDYYTNNASALQQFSQWERREESQEERRLSICLCRCHCLPPKCADSVCMCTATSIWTTSERQWMASRGLTVCTLLYVQCIACQVYTRKALFEFVSCKYIWSPFRGRVEYFSFACGEEKRPVVRLLRNGFPLLLLPLKESQQERLVPSQFDTLKNVFLQ